jgi:hypothetical protein
MSSEVAQKVRRTGVNTTRSQPVSTPRPFAPPLDTKKQHFPPGIHGLSAEIPQVRFQPLARAVS